VGQAAPGCSPGGSSARLDRPCNGGAATFQTATTVLREDGGALTEKNFGRNWAGAPWARGGKPFPMDPGGRRRGTREGVGAYLGRGGANGEPRTGRGFGINFTRRSQRWWPKNAKTRMQNFTRDFNNSSNLKLRQWFNLGCDRGRDSCSRTGRGRRSILRGKNGCRRITGGRPGGSPRKTLGREVGGRSRG